MTRENWDVLERGIGELGLSAGRELETLKVFVTELERWNAKLGLVHASERDLVVRHVLDSLAAVSAISALCAGSPSPAIADLGSGGGFPGLPLACYLPDARFVLIDRSSRKCGFLRNATLAMRAAHVAVVNTEVEDLEGTFDLIVFRAFAQLSDRLLDHLLSLLGPDGSVCAYKGKESRSRDELGTLGPGPSGSVNVRVERLVVPFLQEERHLLILSPRV